MKNAYMNPDYTVREILPSEAVPIADWYNAEFASHCMEIPDHVMPNWEYDPRNGQFYEPGTRPELETRIGTFISEAIDSI